MPLLSQSWLDNVENSKGGVWKMTSHETGRGGHHHYSDKIFHHNQPFEFVIAQFTDDLFDNEQTLAVTAASCPCPQW